MVEGGANFFFLSIPFFFLSFFLILSSQKIKRGLKGGSMVFWGLGGLEPPRPSAVSAPAQHTHVCDINNMLQKPMFVMDADSHR